VSAFTHQQEVSETLCDKVALFVDIPDPEIAGGRPTVHQRIFDAITALPLRGWNVSLCPGLMSACLYVRCRNI
jgi:hypothetical protein